MIVYVRHQLNLDMRYFLLLSQRHDYIISTLDMLKACEAVTHAQTWVSYSTVYRFCSLSITNI